MKIAICLNGKPTGLTKTKDLFFNNIVKKHDCDFFIHSWHSELDDEVLKTYNPKAYKFDYHSLQDDWYSLYSINNVSRQLRLLPGIKPINVYAQLFTISESLKLRKDYENINKINYDVVFRLRFDVAIQEELKFENLDFDRCWFSPHGPRGMPRDFFWFSKSKIMDKFIGIFDNINSYVLKDRQYLCGEEIIFHHVKKNNIPTSTILVRNGLYRPAGHHQGSDRIVNFPPIL